MNPVEIEQAVSDLAEAPYDAQEFPYTFLEAFGRKATEIKRLRTGDANKSDLGGVLQRNNIHIATCPPGAVSATFAALKDSPATVKFKAKFILATDGEEFQAEDLTSGETVACAYADFPNFFGVFLPLAGISTVKQIRESAFDIKATGRLNRLYVELLKDNPDWGTAERRHDMNHFMARLIFCFFAEDTDIFNGTGLFTATVDQMSSRDGSNVHEVISEIFRAMNVKIADRAAANLPRWADVFPYVNGSMFSGSVEVPRFSKIAQRYLSHIGGLDWTKINPDIFGSMIQAVADDDERAVLGMHYTSVPNILKVLNPLFLDDLNAALEEAGDNKRKLLNLRNRIAKIRVFDPACGSGNFLVIAYKQLRAIEAEINRRRGERDRKTDIPLTNFRGIEIRDFSAEIARLALIIAEYQCDVLYRGQQEALAEFLPLDSQNWIICDNALRLDWLSICPPTGTRVKLRSDDLFGTPLDQAQIDFENEGGETYICGNPPYKGNARKSDEQKEDLERLLEGRFEKWGLLDYVCGWFVKAFDFAKKMPARFAFVSTNSVAQGQHVANFWRPLFGDGLRFFFGIRSFKWSNLAANDAGVTVVVVGGALEGSGAVLFDGDSRIEVSNINGYLLPQGNHWVAGARKSISALPLMIKGNYYGMSDHLLLDKDAAADLIKQGLPEQNIKKFFGSTEIINAKPRRCLWFPGTLDENTVRIPEVEKRIKEGVAKRRKSRDAVSNGMVNRPHQFREMKSPKKHTLAVPVVSSENREYLPVDLLGDDSVISNKAFALYDAPLWNMALIASRLHWVWIGTVCVRLEMRFSYSNTLGWNTFPLPKLTEKNREDLTRCAEDILLAREAHFPATIADLYDPETMPADLRAAHERNDETLERIYIGRRFKNDTERLEKLFEMYTRMTTKVST
ncbi:class I SAM-dependent DNA methyltransferase [Caenispirillum bisanense]|uniref:site-specific DNA-methyltransferase (adenine-specific) n=1 Tax=Caenispirillum bisanense TaxID=414052 RepID=A0A286GNU7_9PROT|nr:DNA methyltransferase [Caenispirillum bisanense]SOD97231.1 Type II restriction/modification system, DNA methylase subunit YeeA [Caenispirillum bisanense]